MMDVTRVLSFLRGSWCGRGVQGGVAILQTVIHVAPNMFPLHDIHACACAPKLQQDVPMSVQPLWI